MSKAVLRSLLRWMFKNDKMVALILKWPTSCWIWTTGSRGFFKDPVKSHVWAEFHDCLYWFILNIPRGRCGGIQPHVTERHQDDVGDEKLRWRLRQAEVLLSSVAKRWRRAGRTGCIQVERKSFYTQKVIFICFNINNESFQFGQSCLSLCLLNIELFLPVWLKCG